MLLCTLINWIYLKGMNVMLSPSIIHGIKPSYIERDVISSENDGENENN